MEENKKDYILEYDMTFINVFSIVLLGVIIALSYIFGVLFDTNILVRVGENFINDYVIYFSVMIMWLVLHEVIHSTFYQVMGAKYKNIVYGVALEKGVFYCKCKEYVSKKCILTSVIAPFLLIGVITFIVSFIIDSPLLLFLSIVNISGCSGDLMMFCFFLQQNENVEFKELGFSSPFCLRTGDDLTKKKYYGIKKIKLVKDEKEITEGFEKKVTISKPSWVFIIIMALCLTITLVLEMLV